MEKEGNMSRLILKALGILIGCLLVAGTGCSSSNEGGFNKKWLVVPAASFTEGRLSPSLPACPTADYPLACPEDAGCCPEGYAFDCPAQEKCYKQSPTSECPQYLTCAPVDLIITSISPDEAQVSYDQPLMVTVNYNNYTGIKITDLVIQGLGIDGRFEQAIDPGQQGTVSTTIEVTDQRPGLDTCLLDCSRDGSCGPCFVEDDLLTGWKVDMALRDGQGELWGTLLDFLNLEVDSGGGSDGGICNDGSKCCTTQPDCGGGIGCQVVGITTPEECDCPPNTTYSGNDIHFHVNQCACNDC